MFSQAVGLNFDIVYLFIFENLTWLLVNVYMCHRSLHTGQASFVYSLLNSVSKDDINNTQ